MEPSTARTWIACRFAANACLGAALALVLLGPLILPALTAGNPDPYLRSDLGLSLRVEAPFLLSLAAVLATMLAWYHAPTPLADRATNPLFALLATVIALMFLMALLAPNLI